ncbi:MAG: hypothetical protein IJO87_05935 [Eggerthellaceae bacterium]|nr:hypothetical protein [Eggerthellaceae bacterium]
MNILALQDKGRPESVACEKCACDMTPLSVPVGKRCARFGGLECANPCGLADRVPETGSLERCLNRVEPDEWHAIAPPS